MSLEKEKQRVTISREDYYKLVGLRVLAGELNLQMRTIELAAAGIVGEQPEYDGPGGHPVTWEEICGGSDGSVGNLLKRLDLRLAPLTQPVSEAVSQ